jgi:uncharacterized cupredoxin-like copper-binding protein
MWLVVAGAVAAVILGVVTTVIIAASGVLRPTSPAAVVPGMRCSEPALPGQVIDVTVADMGPGMMGNRPGWGHMGRMWMIVSPATVTAGTVSLRVVNTGVRLHEVVVLPLLAGHAAGQRPVGSNGRTEETGSLGEASQTCGAGAGDGIAPGATGWTTMTLQPGRYELVCNYRGHYPAGMYAELDVTGR